jgi:putative flippase GtrA
MSYLRYFRLLAYSGVLCVLFVYHVCLVYPVLPVSLDWPIVDCPFGIL